MNMHGHCCTDSALNLSVEKFVLRACFSLGTHKLFVITAREPMRCADAQLQVFETEGGRHKKIKRSSASGACDLEYPHCTVPASSITHLLRVRRLVRAQFIFIYNKRWQIQSHYLIDRSCATRDTRETVCIPCKFEANTLGIRSI